MISANKNEKVIRELLAVICLMAIGYVALGTTLSINSTSTINAK